MKKILFILCAMMTSLMSFAQTAINADGTIKYRGNVAIMVTSHSFTFENGQFKKINEDSEISQLKSALNALAMQKFGNSCFGIVNRDNEAYANVRKALEEQKLEDYINGFSVQAKGEGADCLFLSDITMYTENNAAQIFLSCRLLNIANNTGFHYSMKSKAFPATSQEGITNEIRSLISQYEKFLYHAIIDVYPEQYAIAKAEGKKLYLQAYQPNGRILATDQFHAFKFGQESLKLAQGAQPVQVLQRVGTASEATPAGGYCLVKSDKAVTPANDIVLFRELAEPKLTAGPMTMTYFALTYEPNTRLGFIKNRVNNAVYEAMTSHPGAIIIEQEHLPELKKERELQKTEDFIDGHVVEQMKAIGAQYMFHIDNFTNTGNQVSFQLSMISVAENRILRTVDVTSSIDNIENEMYKQICERMAYPCNITPLDKKNLTVLSGWSLPVGGKFIIQANKQMKNPVTGEVSYSKVRVCKCTVTEYMGNKFTAKVSEVLSEDDYKILTQYSQSGAASIMMDGSEIPSYGGTQSSVERVAESFTEKAEKKEKKVGGFLNKLGDAIKGNVTISH